MPVQVLLDFNTEFPGKLQGFGEVHYLTGIASADDPAATTAAVALANARVDLLGRGVFLEEVRLSATTVNRDSLQIPVGEVGNPLSARATPADATLTAYGQADIGNVCCLVRMGLSSKKWRNMYIAGIPDALTNTTLKTVDLAALPLWSTKFTIWKNLIAPAAGGQWGFFALYTGDDGPQYANKPIQGYTTEGVAPNRIGIVMLTADTGWAVNSKLHIRSTILLNKAYRSPVGTWSVGSKTTDAGAGTTTYFLRGTEGINIDNIKEPGTANLVGKTYFNYTYATILGIATRKRGVGSSRARGRSRGKVAKA